MKKLLPIFILILLGIICRFLPHLANFAPIGAIALFGGLYLPKRWAIILPINAMFVSDLFIGLYSWPIMLSVYSGFVLMGAIGILVRRNKKITTVIGGTLIGSLFFFLITNLAVWQFGSMYEHGWVGLMHCYYLALPFFRNSLLGDLFYVGALAGSYELALYFAREKSVVFSKFRT